MTVYVGPSHWLVFSRTLLKTVLSNKIMMEERTGGHYKISSICTYLSIYFNMLIFLKTAKNIVYIHLFVYVCNKVHYTIALFTLVIKI